MINAFQTPRKVNGGRSGTMDGHDDALPRTKDDEDVDVQD